MLPRGISPKVKAEVQLEFKLAYYGIAAENVSHAFLYCFLLDLNTFLNSLTLIAQRL